MSPRSSLDPSSIPLGSGSYRVHGQAGLFWGKGAAFFSIESQLDRIPRITPAEKDTIGKGDYDHMKRVDSILCKLPSPESGK